MTRAVSTLKKLKNDFNNEINNNDDDDDDDDDERGLQNKIICWRNISIFFVLTDMKFGWNLCEISA